MNNSKLETFLGLIIIFIALGFLIFIYNTTHIQNFGSNYNLKAKFDQIDGIVIGSDVRIGGIKIGTVEDLALDLPNYNAVMTLNIDTTIKLPEDSSAKIMTTGLLGSKYLEIIPGSEVKLLKDGDEILHTQSSINLENLIGKLIFKLDNSSQT